MRSISKRFVSAASLFALAALIQPATAQQTNQDYSALPGYSARPQGMCWHRAVGSGNENNGYWGACSNTSQNQSAHAARAQTRTSKRTRARSQ